MTQHDIQTLKNIGSTSVNWLRAVGINSRADLHSAGPVEVYNRIRDRGFRVSRVLLYALEGALLDLHWNDLSPEHKQRLVTEADELFSCFERKCLITARLQVAFNTGNDNIMLRLCHRDEITDGESRGFEINGLAFFIVNQHGNFHAYHNSCPHLGIELNWQDDQSLDYDGQLIQCATHGALFLIHNGHCVAGPCLGQHLKSLPITVENDVICLI